MSMKIIISSDNHAYFPFQPSFFKLEKEIKNYVDAFIHHEIEVLKRTMYDKFIRKKYSLMHQELSLTGKKAEICKFEIEDESRGKRKTKGGYRAIVLVCYDTSNIYLLHLYHKTRDKEDLSQKEKKLVKQFLIDYLKYYHEN